tara:strand:- start:2447 stop:3487 length:1041 start_codon:yes stop_codon:yes gene_type:complete
MGPIIRQTFIVILPTVAVYMALLVLSFVLYPQSPGRMLDPVKARDTFLRTPPAYLTYGSSAVARSGRTVVLLGPSNVSFGFRPNVLNAHFPDLTFHNMSLGGTNIEGMAAMADLVRAMRTDRDLTDVIFVAGLWYGEFQHNEALRERTPVAQQMMRFGLFERADDGYRRTLPLRLFEVSVEALRPYFLVRSILTRDGLLFGDDDTGLLKTRGNQKLVCTDRLRNGFRSASSGSLKQYGSSQFDALVEFAREVQVLGGKLVLIDLPNPRCMTDVDSVWREYQIEKRPFLTKARMHGALYWNFQDINEDRYFMDGTHPNTAGTIEIEARFSAGLAKEIGTLFTESPPH